jgi:hypothetical protein
MSQAMNMRRRVKELSFRAFLILERGGVHVLPRHYYTPVADRSWLRENRPRWQRRVSMTGVHWDLDEQLAWLEGTTAEHYGEVRGLHRHSGLVSGLLGPGYGPIESQVLHCFVRRGAPARIVEVGGGMSTAIEASAVAMNEAEGRGRTAITTIEPFPSDALSQLGSVRLVREPAQAVSADVFAELGAGDLLFVDSTHTVKTGSEVLRLYLEIVPSLPPGVIVHVHDVTLPYLFPPDVLTNYFDWQETGLVLALLTGNEHLRVRCCLSALHHDRPRDLQRILPDYRPRRLSGGLVAEDDEGHFPSSLWLETV